MIPASPAFTPEGHLLLAPTELLRLARESPRRLVNDFLLAGTPFLFDRHFDYCGFRSTLASRLFVHPGEIAIRGSARLGYSIAPRSNKAWRMIDEEGLSDIDVAIVSVDYFQMLDFEVRRWEEDRPVPGERDIGYKLWMRRKQDRNFRCIADWRTPPGTCRVHAECMDSFDSSAYCGTRRKLSVMVFRDWWAMRNRWEYDLVELCRKVELGEVDTAARNLHWEDRAARLRGFEDGRSD